MRSTEALKLAGLSGLLFCLAGLLVSVGCSKGGFGRTTAVDNRWTCDKEADDAMQKGAYGSGIVLHQRFLQEEPENALAWYHLGYAYGQMGDHPKEAFHYEKAIALGFRENRIFFNLGMAYGELNQAEKSIRAFRKALEIDPDSADNHFGLAMAYQRDFVDQLAEQAFLKAIDLAPEHLDARLYLSILYADRGDLKKAEGQLRKILEIDPTHKTAQEFLEAIGNE